ncbi:MAG: aminotransferase class I/II-fold pyridoxal phosphate-dependent enzyme [Haliscomenobacter sp.]|uniref:aminotransferase class I/II-fold pyridoxal phosphate-dependent enzyme n=1 Tax=Haliscomenobacter sp. TaxID=2717303 RepID=UPI0029ACB953|nr:aminotransferase class I/II-fold pyridoxal phosphate-dependent enzyme [Haliscomenobacter sp.]MDX2068219.1 aminotransferase class I/II-fold pyridoxal phosphate-dependent enzyme [Haliscomenobacter sp.]
MYSINQLPGRCTQIDGENWLYFSGTGYLGAAWNEDLQALVREGIQKFGLHFGGSRLSNIQINIFGEAEAFLAQNAGAEQALLLSSGTLAGQLLMKVLGTHGEVFPAPGAHPAIWAGAAPSIKSWEDWVEKAVELANQPGAPLILAANSVDPLYVRQFDFKWLQHLKPQRELILVIDDSHGFGVLGENGAGIYSQVNLPAGAELLVVSSLGKALGIPAGVILGPKFWMERLLRNPYFGGASPPSPGFLWALLQGQAIYIKARQKLQLNVRQFVQYLSTESDFHFFPEYPVFYTANSGLATFLAERKILISSFPYPTPQDDLVTRIVLSSLHTEGDLETLIKILQFKSQKPRS